MDWALFPRGLLIGLSIAVPVGPMAILVIRRTLVFGWVAGLVTGLGVACGDAVFGLVAAFGLTAISDLLLDHQNTIRVVGGAFLGYLGVSILRSANTLTLDANESLPTRRYLAAFTSTFGLTLANPPTILFFLAVFAGFGTVGALSSNNASLMVLGVFGGSVSWWLALAGGTSLLRGKLTAKRLKWVNRIGGITILLFGLLSLASVIV